MNICSYIYLASFSSFTAPVATLGVYLSGTKGAPPGASLHCPYTPQNPKMPTRTPLTLTMSCCFPLSPTHRIPADSSRCTMDTTHELSCSRTFWFARERRDTPNEDLSSLQKRKMRVGSQLVLPPTQNKHVCAMYPKMLGASPLSPTAMRLERLDVVKSIPGRTGRSFLNILITAGHCSRVALRLISPTAAMEATACSVWWRLPELLCHTAPRQDPPAVASSAGRWLLNQRRTPAATVIHGLGHRNRSLYHNNIRTIGWRLSVERQFGTFLGAYLVLLLDVIIWEYARDT